MSTNLRQEAYLAVLHHLNAYPPITAGEDIDNMRAVAENARVWSAVRVALDVAGVPPLPGGLDETNQPLPGGEATE